MNKPSMKELSLQLFPAVGVEWLRVKLLLWTHYPERMKRLGQPSPEKLISEFPSQRFRDLDDSMKVLTGEQFLVRDGITLADVVDEFPAVVGAKS